jgi:hypothetical protein
LLWVRCGESSPKKFRSSPNSASRKEVWRNSENRLEQVLRATDLLLESGGFGVIALDLADLPPQAARRIPLTTWFRFRRAVEPTSTVLLTVEHQPIAGSCSSLLIKLTANSAHYLSHDQVSLVHDHKSARATGTGLSHARLLERIESTAEVLRSRLERKPPGSAAATFASRTFWADEKAG